MSRDRTIGLLIAVSTFAALALNPTIAHAEKSEASDSTGDVVQFSEDFDSTTPAPEDRTTDVIKSVTTYSKSRVTVKLKLQDLTGGALNGAFSDIKTNRKRYNLSLFKLPGSGSDFVLEDKSGEVTCKGKRKTYSASKDLIKMSVPRSCLRNPRWVKVAVVSLGIQESGTLADDALRTGLKSSGKLTFGPKLNRG